MATDRLQQDITVGDYVGIIGRITAIGGTPAAPTVVITTKYAGFDGNTDVIAAVDSIQVVKDTSVPKN